MGLPPLPDALASGFGEPRDTRIHRARVAPARYLNHSPWDQLNSPIGGRAMVVLAMPGAQVDRRRWAIAFRAPQPPKECIHPPKSALW
jgi:hypothetical protein